MLRGATSHHRLEDLVEAGQAADRLAHRQQRVGDRGRRRVALGVRARRLRGGAGTGPIAQLNQSVASGAPISSSTSAKATTCSKLSVHERAERNHRDQHGAVGELDAPAAWRRRRAEERPPPSRRTPARTEIVCSGSSSSSGLRRPPEAAIGSPSVRTLTAMSAASSSPTHAAEPVAQREQRD